ncbi:hypothetical protein [Endozoicomonas sp. SCSIO W0465]|uniref:hypothetical protein n=1 Tax=Endozoicomonas sp. SCSIO W0465 TaxID=2918516 RepID=UPI002074E8E3|nr:hypothetical protein [Endozoicomonas sp. SCSIO W0465]USE37996.1 hypothetical protein MJO57_07395 [Endozoicomonas sp. SCSIO W0465]
MSQNKYKSIQDLVDNYIASGLSAREYVEARVDAGDLSAAEALKLLSILREAQSITFKLAEVSDDGFSGLHMVLMRKEEEEPADDTSPLFSIEIDESLNSNRDDVINLLQKFAKELAVLATRGELEEAEAIDTIDDHPEDWLDHPNILPASETRH